jgi:hypothetical protein
LKGKWGFLLAGFGVNAWVGETSAETNCLLTRVVENDLLVPDRCPPFFCRLS